MKKTIFTVLLLVISTTAAPGGPARPTVGLVLSGGGARGAAHIGVLRALEEARIPIDVIAGTSFGSMVGGLYSVGFSPADIELIFKSIDWNEVFDETPARHLTQADDKPRLDRRLLTLGVEELEVQLPTGLQAGQKVSQMLGRLTAGPLFQAGNDFDRLEPRFRAVAADLLTGKAFVFDHGALWRAVRASIAVPGFFTPVDYQGHLLVDGGLADNLPVNTAKDAGADLVIAIDISSPLRTRKDQFKSLVDVLDQVIGFQITRQTLLSRESADLVIVPELKDFSAANFAEADQLIAEGEKAVAARLNELERLLDLHGVPLDGVPRQPLLEIDTFDPEEFSWESDELRIDRTELEGLSRFDDAARAATRGPRPKSVSEIDRQVSRLYALDRFKEVDYRLEERQGKNVLIYEFQERPPSRLGVGFRYDPEYNFTAAFEALGRGFPRSRSELEFRALLGNVNSVELEWRDRSLLGGGLTLAPRVFAFSNPRRFFPDQSDRSRPFDDRRAGFDLSLRHVMGNRALFEGRYRLENVEADDQSGSGRVRNRQASLSFRSRLDTLDDLDFPTGGLRAAVSAEWLDSALGSEVSLSRFQASLRHVLSLKPGSTWSLDGSWGLLRGDQIPFYESFFTGGVRYLSFSSGRFIGLQRDRIRSRHTILMGSGFRQKLKSFQLGFIKDVYLAGHYQAGLFNQTGSLTEFRELLQGFGAGLHLDTRFLGPIRFDAGGTSEGDYRAYFSIGHFF